ncbi:hypothetical protein JOM56_005279 [Amanita muscaria]
MPRTLVQLAMHEAELVQLKRKWESFKSPPGSTSPSSLLPYDLTSSTHLLYQSRPGPFLKAAKKVSRLIASGLSASLHQATITTITLASPFSLHSQSRPSTTQPRHKPKPRPHSLYSPYQLQVHPCPICKFIRVVKCHVINVDIFIRLSVTTPARVKVLRDEQNATKSPTKIRETCSFNYSGAKVAEDAGVSNTIDSWSLSELIVRDTGATPMMKS